jgi:hypothetical protein
MASTRSSVSFSSVPPSQKLVKVDEDTDLASDSFDLQLKPTRQSMYLPPPKLTEKEERFKNKYRWAEKQHKLRTGRCEGYSFTSIKAGLHRQDFRDTLHWSPINHAKIADSRHFTDVVAQLLHNHGTPTDTTLPNLNAGVAANESTRTDSASHPLVAQDRMSEKDFQVAKSRKLDPLRGRGANTLSARMNLDSFIDSALSEQIKEDDKSNAPSDLSLGELQSAKLIESRYGWSKVRRAVTTTTSTAVAIKTSGKHTSSPTKTGSTGTDDDCGFEHEPTTPTGNENARNRPATAGAGRNPLTFCVPASATHIRPRSAAVHPSGNPQATIAPLDEFVQIVRQERPKTASKLLESATLHTARPRTATLRIAPPPPIYEVDPVTDTEIIQAMLSSTQVVEKKQAEGLTLRLKEKQISGSYSGLIYHDPSRQATWRGVSDLIAPAPYVKHKSEAEEAETARMAQITDMRWAGKTLNSYRPWSPVRRPPQLNLSAVDTTLGQSTSTARSSHNNSARMTGRATVHDVERGVPLPLEPVTETDHSEKKPAVNEDEDEAPRRIRRPTSEHALSRRRDDNFISMSTIGADASFRDASPAPGPFIRHMSSPSLLGPAATEAATAPARVSSFSPRHSVAHSASESATLRPFSARPASAAPVSAAVVRRPRPSTGTAGTACLPAASPAVRNNSVTTTPRATAGSRGGTHTQSLAQQSSSVFSSHAHTASRTSGGTKRAPLLVNIITSKPVSPY